MSQYQPHDLDESALDDAEAVEAEVGVQAEAVPEEWSTVVRFRADPYSRELEAGPKVPADTILGHLANALTVLGMAISFSEGRVADGGEVTMWAPITVEDAARIRSRILAVQEELVDAFERQQMLDTSAHADNLPF